MTQSAAHADGLLSVVQVKELRGYFADFGVERCAAATFHTPSMTTAALMN